MLNTKLLTRQLEVLGLNQSEIAAKCDVSREAVSNWFKQESLPRPSKLKKLAEVLAVPISELVLQTKPQITFAYRTKQNRQLTASAKKFAETLAMRLDENSSFFPEKLFGFPVLESPNLKDSYISTVATTVRKQLSLEQFQPVPLEGLFQLLSDFGAHFIPVTWGGDKKGHENALTVLSFEPKNYFVLLNLNVKGIDAKYWVAHEYGHCLSLHELTEDLGEEFSERFAQELLFPTLLAESHLEEFLAQANKIKFISSLAKEFGLHPYHVYKQFERALKAHEQEMPISSQGFYKAISRSLSSDETLLSLIGVPEQLNGKLYLEILDRLKSPLGSALSAALSSNSLDPKMLSEMLGISIADSMDVIKAVSSRAKLSS